MTQHDRGGRLDKLTYEKLGSGRWQLLKKMTAGIAAYIVLQMMLISSVWAQQADKMVFVQGGDYKLNGSYDIVLDSFI